MVQIPLTLILAHFLYYLLVSRLPLYLAAGEGLTEMLASTAGYVVGMVSLLMCSYAKTELSLYSETAVRRSRRDRFRQQN